MRGRDFTCVPPAAEYMFWGLSISRLHFPASVTLAGHWWKMIFRGGLSRFHYYASRSRHFILAAFDCFYGNTPGAVDWDRFPIDTGFSRFSSSFTARDAICRFHFAAAILFWCFFFFLLLQMPSKSPLSLLRPWFIMRHRDYGFYY